MVFAITIMVGSTVALIAFGSWIAPAFRELFDGVGRVKSRTVKGQAGSGPEIRHGSSIGCIRHFDTRSGSDFGTGS